MAKVSLNKLIEKKSLDAKTVIIADQEVSIKQYLGIDEKSALVERVLNDSIDNIGNFSPVRLKVYFTLDVIRTYTNITITEAQYNTPGKTYDSLMINNIVEQIFSNIPEKELDGLKADLFECAEAITTYNHSLVGMFKAMTTDYDSTKMDVDGLLKDLSDPEKVGLVKDILTKL